MSVPGVTFSASAAASASGLSGADLSQEQRTALLELIANWAGIADEKTSAAALTEIEATLDETVIAWSGASSYDMSTGEGVSFSISGLRVYIGFETQQGSAGADGERCAQQGGQALVGSLAVLAL